MTGPGPVSVVARFLHGDGAVVVVPARVAAWLDQEAGLRSVRTRHRGEDAEVDAVLVALGVAAATWRTSVGSATGSDTGTAVDAPSEPARPSPVMTTSQAADRLDIGTRAVVKAIHAGRLTATRPGRAWLIDRDDVEHYRARTTPC